MNPIRRNWLCTLVGALCLLGAADSLVPAQPGPVLSRARTCPDWFNVKAYGARGDGTADDTAAIQAAAAAVGSDGGVVYFPAGTYRITATVEVSSRTWLLGIGRGSVVQATALAVMFELADREEIRVSHLSFEFLDPTNFNTALRIQPGARDIVVDSCNFEAATFPEAYSTLHAVLARGARNVWITNNRLYHMQLKTAGPKSGPDPSLNGPVTIARNLIIEPHNWGITAVAVSENDEVNDYTIVDNIIQDPGGGGGIAVGTDQGGRIQSCQRIIVRGNIVRGTWSAPGEGVGILLAPGAESKDWLVEGNVLVGDGNIAASIGIKLNTATPDGIIRGVTIANNQIRGFNKWALQLVGGDVSGLVVSGNTIHGTQGIIVRRKTMRDVTISGNQVLGSSSHGLLLQTLFSDDQIGPVLVRDNIFKNCNGDGIRLETVSGEQSSIIADLIGNVCFDDRLSPVQPFGIRELGPGTFDTRYLHNDVRGNVVGGLGLVNSAAVVRDNRGWATESSGAGEIVSPATSITLNHGLDIGPLALSARDFTITPIGNPLGDPGHIWITDITATQFTVHCANDPGDSLGFEWRAQLTIGP